MASIDGIQLSDEESGITTHLGKIDYIRLGEGGYQDACFGLTISFLFDKCCGVSDFKGTWWPGSIDPDKHAKWTEEDRREKMADLAYFIAKTMRDAKVRSFEDLKGKPVEVKLKNQSLYSWRILTEVL